MSTAAVIPSILGAALTAGIAGGASQLLAIVCATASGQPIPQASTSISG